MSNQPGLSFGGAPQGNGAGGDQQPVAPSPGSETPKYVTLEEVQRLAKEAGEEAYRRAQSLYDKQSNNIAKKVQDGLRQVERSFTLLNPGQQMTPEQRAAVQQKLITEALSEEPQQPGQQPTPESLSNIQPDQQPPAGTGAGVDDIEAKTQALYTRYGITVEESDPEAKAVKVDGSEAEFLQGLEKALIAKTARIGQQSQIRAQLPAQGGKGNPISEIVDPNTLFKMGLGES